MFPRLRKEVDMAGLKDKRKEKGCTVIGTAQWRIHLETAVFPEIVFA